MMDCAQYRRALLRDPRDPDPLLRAHCAHCAACARFTDRLQRFEGRLEGALRVSIDASVLAPSGPAAGSPRAGRSPWMRARSGHRSRLALAASVLLGVFVAGGLWLALPRSSLAGDVVAHMAEEPQAWARSGQAVAPAKLDAVLQNTGMRLAGTAGLVSYANSCGFRGHNVPHLVVQTDGGPITVMVLVHESVARPTPFEEAGYRGILLPMAGHGSLAVLSKGAELSAADLAAIAGRVRAAIVWSA